MTFKEFLKQKKGIDPVRSSPVGKRLASIGNLPLSEEASNGVDTSRVDPMDFMDEYYDEYTEYLASVKDGCGPKE